MSKSQFFSFFLLLSFVSRFLINKVLDPVAAQICFALLGTYGGTDVKIVDKDGFSPDDTRVPAVIEEISCAIRGETVDGEPDVYAQQCVRFQFVMILFNTDYHYVFFLQFSNFSLHNTEEPALSDIRYKIANMLNLQTNPRGRTHRIDQGLAVKMILMAVADTLHNHSDHGAHVCGMNIKEVYSYYLSLKKDAVESSHDDKTKKIVAEFMKKTVDDRLHKSPRKNMQSSSSSSSNVAVVPTSSSKKSMGLPPPPPPRHSSSSRPILVGVDDTTASSSETNFDAESNSSPKRQKNAITSGAKSAELKHDVQSPGGDFMMDLDDAHESPKHGNIVLFVSYVCFISHCFF